MDFKGEEATAIMQSLRLFTECTFLSQIPLFCNFDVSIIPLFIFEEFLLVRVF